MNILLGIAPSRHSHKSQELSEPWCPNTTSGEKIRRLASPTHSRFANASDVYPGYYENSKGELVDKTPWVSTGLERLSELIDGALPEKSTNVLLLGISYWTGVLEMAERQGRLGPHSGLHPAKFIPFKDHDGAVAAEVVLFPHPRHWPEPQGRDPTEYRSEVKLNLARRKAKPFDKIGADDIERVFKRFELGEAR
jgi:hypothetical protein